MSQQAMQQALSRLLWLIDYEPPVESISRSSWVNNWNVAVGQARATLEKELALHTAAQTKVTSDDLHWFDDAFRAWENNDFVGVLDGLNVAVSHFVGTAKTIPPDPCPSRAPSNGAGHSDGPHGTCTYCKGNGWTEEGDPEIGSCPMTCDICSGSGKTMAPMDEAEATLQAVWDACRDDPSILPADSPLLKRVGIALHLLKNPCTHCEGRQMVQDEQGNIWPCPQGCTPRNDEGHCQACVGSYCTARSGCEAMTNHPMQAAAGVDVPGEGQG